MCGIFGLWEVDGNIDMRALQRSVRTLRHRGPDDEGYLLWNLHNAGQYVLAGGEDTPWEVFRSNYLYSPKKTFDALLQERNRYNLALAHRRLSIIDLSPSGHQPMCNENGTIWIVYNGEIYNFRELRKELESLGHRFASNTDTEVIIHAYEEWGPGCLNKFNGMWAFCIWDARMQQLFCSRDRLGIKPLYYFFDGRRFFFSSEIKALLEYGLPRRANDALIYDYLSYGLLDHTAHTLFEGIHQLRGGEYLELNLITQTIRTNRYWKAEEKSTTAKKSAEEYAIQLYELLRDAVRLRLISDVPVGSCLSGGIDSSVVVSLVDRLMRENGLKIPGSDIQKTFSARYGDQRHDEGRFIEAVVNQTQSDAHFVYPTGEGLLKEIDQIIYHQDEPFGSTSIYAQWCVFRLAKASGVKVVLDGQGADELLAGYDGFYITYMADLLRSLRWVQLLDEARKFVAIRPTYSLSKVFYSVGVASLPRHFKQVLRRVRHLGRPSPNWLHPDMAQLYQQHPREKYPRSLDEAFVQTLTETTLPALLHYEDRDSMAHSIESRLPYLDYRVVEFLLAVPADQKISFGINKRVLRAAATGLIPEVVRQRRDKIGFSTPEDVWFREAMRGFIESIIASKQFQNRPYFDCKAVQAFVQSYMEGKNNDSSALWRIINLELWLRSFID